MTCDDIQPLLTAYHLNELKPREVKTVRAHLDSCENCRAESEEIRATLSIVGDALVVPTGSETKLTEDRRHEVFASATTSTWWNQTRLVQVAACLTVLLVLGAMLLPALKNTMQRTEIEVVSMEPETADLELAQMDADGRTPWIEINPPPPTATARPAAPAITAPAESAESMQMAASKPQEQPVVAGGHLDIALNEDMLAVLDGSSARAADGGGPILGDQPAFANGRLGAPGSAGGLAETGAGDVMDLAKTDPNTLSFRAKAATGKPKKNAEMFGLEPRLSSRDPEEEPAALQPKRSYMGRLDRNLGDDDANGTVAVDGTEETELDVIEPVKSPLVMKGRYARRSERDGGEAPADRPAVEREAGARTQAAKDELASGLIATGKVVGDKLHREVRRAQLPTDPNRANTYFKSTTEVTEVSDLVVANQETVERLSKVAKQPASETEHATNLYRYETGQPTDTAAPVADTPRARQVAEGQASAAVDNKLAPGKKADLDLPTLEAEETSLEEGRDHAAGRWFDWALADDGLEPADFAKQVQDLEAKDIQADHDPADTPQEPPDSRSWLASDASGNRAGADQAVPAIDSNEQVLELGAVVEEREKEQDQAPGPTNVLDENAVGYVMVHVPDGGLKLVRGASVDGVASASSVAANVLSTNAVGGGLNLTIPDTEPATPAVFQAYGVNPYIGTATNAFSTFSIDTDSASYTMARRYILGGQLPPAESVRTEEFVNFFGGEYSSPDHRTFAVEKTCAPSPFSPGLQLLQVGVKGQRIGRDQQRRAMLTFAIDTSGSMKTPDRIGLVRTALTQLLDQLHVEDEVAIVQFGSSAHLVLEATPAAEKDKIVAAVNAIQISGSTHLEEGISLAYQVAAQNFVSGGMNRVLILSDGAANLGEARADVLVNQVATYRDQGIYCSVFGFGIGTYNDVILETLANRGDGSYQFIDSEDEVQRVFVQDLSATLHTIAADVKIQVEFNPARVKQFRQIGYENRQLKKQDFRNDAVDAGEVGSGQSVAALYEVELQGNDTEDLGVVRIRYRDLNTGVVEEIESPIRRQDLKTRFDDTSPRFRLMAAAAEFAEILRGSPYASGSDFQDVAEVLRPVALDLHLDPGVQELLRLVQTAPGLPRAAE